MKITYSQILELWTIKLNFNALRKIERHWNLIWTQWILLIPAIMLSRLNSKIVIFSLGFNLICSFLIFYLLISIKKYREIGRPRYAIVTILFGMYDILTKTILFIVILCTSIAIEIGDRGMLSITGSFSGWLWSILIIITVTTIIWMPRIINKRNLENSTEWLERQSPIYKKITLAIPGLSVMVAGFLVRSGKIDAAFTLIEVLLIFVVFYALHFIVIDIYELILLKYNEWPNVKRSGSKFTVSIKSAEK